VSGAGRTATALRWLRRGASRAIHPLSFVSFGFGTVLAVIYTRVGAPQDWRLFYDTALLLLSGRVDELYPGVTAGYPFLYPPPFVWHVAWLGFLSPGAAHVSLVLAMITALLAALWLLHTRLDDRGRRLDSWIFAVLSSASWFWLVTAGHIAAWRVLAGAFIVIALLALSTLPLGAIVWTKYFAQFGSLRGVVSAIAPWKQITLLAFWRSVFGENSPRMVVVATALSAAPCVAFVAVAWIRLARKAVAIPRLLALTVLMLLSCNAYAFHYDGLLLAIPGAVWYLRDHEYANEKHHLAVGILIFFAFAAQHASSLLREDGVALTGPVLAAWLIIDGRDLFASHIGREGRPLYSGFSQ